MSDERTLAVYDAKAEEYARINLAEGPNPALTAFIEQLPTNSFILDFGCGPAIEANIIRSAGLRVDPMDGSHEMVKLANATYGIGARQALFDELEGESIYDGIWANYSLLHASEAAFPQLLKALHTALKPRGWFHIAMKLGEGTSRDKIERNYTYYSEPVLLDHLTKAGFEPLDITRGKSAGMSGEISPWITVLSRGKSDV
ncbi:MAG: methyltransferase domain-containing protein [Rhizobiaceae bacterium]